MLRKNRTNLVFIAAIAALYFTGLLSHIATFSQSMVVSSGLVNADVDDSMSEDFDFGFSIKDLENKEVSPEQFKGKVIFLNLWATWCGPCKAEMPSIQKLYDQVDHDKIKFVMLSIDREKDFHKVKKFVADRGFTFPVFASGGYMTDQLNVPSIPTTFVVSSEGKIVMKEVGMKNYDTQKFKKFLERLSDKK
jgi:thiol-disulfide isomerase/thioredoxin